MAKKGKTNKKLQPKADFPQAPCWAEPNVASQGSCPARFLPKQKRLKVMAFGTFDILHPGHLFYLNEAGKLGASLFVVVSTDENAGKIKGRKPLNNEKIRLGKIRNLRIVDKAILGSNKDMFSSIEKIKPDVIALGYDQKAEWLRDKIREEKMKIDIVRIPPFEEKRYKSSLMIGKILK